MIIRRDTQVFNSLRIIKSAPQEESRFLIAGAQKKYREQPAFGNAHILKAKSQKQVEHKARPERLISKKKNGRSTYRFFISRNALACALSFHDGEGTGA